ncbi:hypothetical protein [Campylobacter helveticus]|nr:hypothetical protein [Campylobacter helveticus]MCR2067230.1 hypothetical protein [Campylobacter helveticus]
MSIDISWDTRRYFLERRGVSYNYEWIERTLSCVDVAKENMIPKRQSDDK